MQCELAVQRSVAAVDREADDADDADDAEDVAVLVRRP